MKGKPIAAGSDVIITDVGINTDGNALICATSLIACCNSAASGGSKLGNWTFSNNGSSIGGPIDGGDFYVTRNNRRQVILQRRNDAMGPLGMFCCEVATITQFTGASICANLGS